MNGIVLLLAIHLVIVVPLLGWTYLRQRRVSGFLGWAIMIPGLLLLLGGGGEEIPWGGLLWTFVTFAGFLLVLFDLLALRARRRE